MSADGLPESQAATPVSTEQPQPAKEEEPKPEERLAALKESISALQKHFPLIEDPAMYDQVRGRFASDYDACRYLAQSIVESVAPPLQGEYFSQIRSIIAMHPRAKELTTTLTLAWYDLHYQGEPSRLLQRLEGMRRDDLPPMRERFALVLALLHSGYSSMSGEREFAAAVEEILSRREAFKSRQLAGAGVMLLSLEDSSSVSPGGFTRLAESIGTSVSRVNAETTARSAEAFYHGIAGSDPKMPLTIVLTVHGMAQEGGYMALPNDERVTPPQFAAALQKRGTAENVTILSSQCYPRSSRPEDSFFDNLTQQCRERGIGVPAVYMESTENQPGILNPRTHPEGEGFQTLRLATEAYQGGGRVSGADILRASNDVLGNQPSLVIPPTAASQLKLKNEVASRTTDNVERRETA